MATKVTSVVCLKRKNGVVVQGCDIYIGRKISMGGWNLPESKWHNPYKLKECASAEECIKKFREYIMQKPDLLAQIHELRGKTLGCWCKKKGHEPCHGDVLVELVNTQTT